MRRAAGLLASWFWPTYLEGCEPGLRPCWLPQGRLHLGRVVQLQQLLQGGQVVGDHGAQQLVVESVGWRWGLPAQRHLGLTGPACVRGRLAGGAGRATRAP